MRFAKVLVCNGKSNPINWSCIVFQKNNHQTIVAIILIVLDQISLILIDQSLDVLSQEISARGTLEPPLKIEHLQPRLEMMSSTELYFTPTYFLELRAWIQQSLKDNVLVSMLIDCELL